MSNESSERICPECGHGESMWDKDLGCQGPDPAFPDRPGIPCGHRCLSDRQKLLELVKSIAFHPDDHDTEVSFYAPGDDFAVIKFHDTKYEIREKLTRSRPTVEAAEIGNENGNVVGAILKLIDLDENFECHWNRIRQRWSVSIPTLGIDIADESLLAVMQATLTAARDAAPIPSENDSGIETTEG